MLKKRKIPNHKRNTAKKDPSGNFPAVPSEQFTDECTEVSDLLFDLVDQVGDLRHERLETHLRVVLLVLQAQRAVQREEVVVLPLQLQREKQGRLSVSRPPKLQQIFVHFGTMSKMDRILL